MFVFTNGCFHLGSDRKQNTCPRYKHFRKREAEAEKIEAATVGYTVRTSLLAAELAAQCARLTLRSWLHSVHVSLGCSAFGLHVNAFFFLVTYEIR